MKILIAEHSSSVRKKLAQIITFSFPAEVVEAEDGHMALNKFNDCGPFELIISNSSMPKMNGFQLLKFIKHINESMPFIMLSADDDHQDQMVALHDGADNFLANPFTTSQLVEKINLALHY